MRELDRSLLWLACLRLRLDSRLLLGLLLWLRLGSSLLFLWLWLGSLSGLRLSLCGNICRQSNAHVLQHLHGIEGSAFWTMHTLHQISKRIALGSPWSALEKILEWVCTSLSAKSVKHRCRIKGLCSLTHHIWLLIWVWVCLWLWRYILNQMNCLVIFLNYKLIKVLVFLPYSESFELSTSCLALKISRISETAMPVFSLTRFLNSDMVIWQIVS